MNDNIAFSRGLTKGIFLWCVLHTPVWMGRCNIFSGCNKTDFICVNPTVTCSCSTFVADMTLVSHSETDFQAKFPQGSQVQFASFFPLLLRCKWLSLKCGIACEYLFTAPMTPITNHSPSSFFLDLYPNWKTVAGWKTWNSDDQNITTGILTLEISDYLIPDDTFLTIFCYT